VQQQCDRGSVNVSFSVCYRQKKADVTVVSRQVSTGGLWIGRSAVGDTILGLEALLNAFIPLTRVVTGRLASIVCPDFRS